jgi:hypothetical protein
MLNNIALPSVQPPDEGTFPAASSLHEALSVSSVGVTKAGFSSNLHYEGTLVNASGITLGGDFGAVVFILSVPAGTPEPARQQVLDVGLPLLPSGSAMELPKESHLDFYLATDSQSPVTCRGAYFGRSAPAPVS